MFGWFRKKLKRKRISGDFVLEILPPLNTATRGVSIMRRRLQRIQHKDITDLSVADLMCHVDTMSSSLSEIESHLMNCNNRIVREREQ